MKRLSVIIMSALLACTQLFAAPSEKILVFLCFGQSNMEGNAAVEEIDDWNGRRFQKMLCADSYGTDLGK